ncbi:class I SAM-dependent methyltransferase [Streptomyces sp. LHD-70]|uniref:class I SAM-dependent methyltransferase n=1 Tax=Streptomyces sp. LHD-70 TaxID=3072140 RepID=UPI0028100B45|nr:class I SAM-dependent methyltransferase [Streptomyces sp. LHD-70]MDQ8705202.1 class I SAM-dependent methyltransferase [Streptomyces sp. LHD-70]
MPDSYTDLADHYDLIMTSGYYDYDTYAQALLDAVGDRRDLLEVGVGTGLVCESLLRLGPPDLRITGIDHTDSMLDKARDRLGSRVRLQAEDAMDLSFSEDFDVAYSVGGVCLIVEDGDRWWMSSHLMEEEETATALKNIATALEPGGLLLMSVQGPHEPYERPLPGGLTYAQEIEVDPEGRHTKDYFIRRHDTLVAHQRLSFRLFPQEKSEALLEQAGFRFLTGDRLLRRYVRR